MRVGFIGLGVMGAPIAARIARAGHVLRVHDLRRTEVPGAAWAPSAADAVKDAEVVFTSLPGPAEVAALVALHRPDQLRGHIWRALDNGVTREELAELFTQLAFYAGWANGISAAQVAKQVYEERG